MEPLLGLALVTLVTLLGLENAQGSPQGVDPIPPQQLYNEFLKQINKPGCLPKRIKGIKIFAKCMDSKPALIDYGCRYYNLLSNFCFCCGQTCSYVEQGDICTRFCIKGSKIPRGQPSIIDLPFDWGDEPHCTPDIVSNSTTQSNESENLKIQEEPDNMDGISIEIRKDTGKPDEAKTPPMIQPDCKGNNCPPEAVAVQAPVDTILVTSVVTPTDVPLISSTISNVPPTHKPVSALPATCGHSDPQYYPHPTDCQKYFQCAEGHPPSEKSCSDTMKWDRVSGSCDHADHVNCPSLMDG